MSQYESGNLGHHHFALPQGSAKLPGDSAYQESDLQNTTQDYTLNPQINQTTTFSSHQDAKKVQARYEPALPQSVNHHQSSNQVFGGSHQGYQQPMDHNPPNLMSPRQSNTSHIDNLLVSHDFVVPGVPLPVPDLDTKDSHVHQQ